MSAGASPPFFGWGCFEHTEVGFSPCTQPQAPTTAMLAVPHAPGGGCVSLTGGVVVDDPSLGAAYQGRYVYGYFCAPTRASDGGHSRLLSADLDAPTRALRSEGLFVTTPGGGAGVGLVSFGEDGCGHLYAMNLLTGWLFRIEGDTPGPCGQHRPPDTTITGAPDGVVAEADARVTFASSVRGSTFTCRLDGGAPASCTSPAVFGGLGDGDHALEVAARDEAGNVDPSPARAVWRTELPRVPEPPTATPPGDAAAPPAPPPTRAQDAVSPLAGIRLLGARRIRASRTGRVVLRLGGFTEPPRIITRVRRAGRPAGTARGVTAGAGRTARVAIVLSPSMRSLLRRRGRITLAVTLRLTAACEGREVVLPLVVMR